VAGPAELMRKFKRVRILSQCLVEDPRRLRAAPVQRRAALRDSGRDDASSADEHVAAVAWLYYFSCRFIADWQSDSAEPGTILESTPERWEL